MDLVRFGVYWVDFDPAIGSEINKTRPAVVVSPDEMNHNLKTVLVCPLTSTLRNYPSRIKVTIKGRVGEIAVDQMRAIDQIRIKGKFAILTEEQSDNLVAKIVELVQK